MKILMSVLLFSCLMLAACNSGRQVTSDKMDLNQLNGTWQLDSVAGPEGVFNNLYPNRKPVVTFNVVSKLVNGNSGCNNFSGPFTLSGFNVDFNGPLVTTRMACPGEGESVFFNTLKSVTNFAVTDSTTLNLLRGDAPAMRFHKIPTP